MSRSEARTQNSYRVMLTRKQKEEIVKNLEEKLKENKLMVFCNFEGISIEKQRELKKKLKENDGEIFVVKRRLLQRALLKEKINFPEITGPVMVAASKDEILSAKIIFKFQKEKKEKLEFIGGIIKDYYPPATLQNSNHPPKKEKYRVLSKEEIEELVKLPSREDLLTKLVGTLRAPVVNLENVLRGNLQKLLLLISTNLNNKQS